jgi:hypothetical protein
VESIPTEYRREASYIFQLTLHNERSFITLYQLNTMDLFYIGEARGSPLTHPGKDDDTKVAFTVDPQNTAELDLRLQTTARRINSRCRGLVQCYYVAGDLEGRVGLREVLVLGARRYT